MRHWPKDFIAVTVPALGFGASKRAEPVTSTIEEDHDKITLE